MSIKRKAVSVISTSALVLGSAFGMMALASTSAHAEVRTTKSEAEIASCARAAGGSGRLFIECVR